MVSGKNPTPGKKSPREGSRGRVRVMLGIGLGLGSAGLFSGGDFFLEPFSIYNLDLMNIARIIGANIATHINELNLLTDFVDAIIKLFPVLYICNNKVNCFINLHGFVFLPGVL